MRRGGGVLRGLLQCEVTGKLLKKSLGSVALRPPLQLYFPPVGGGGEKSKDRRRSLITKEGEPG